MYLSALLHLAFPLTALLESINQFQRIKLHVVQLFMLALHSKPQHYVFYHVGIIDATNEILQYLRERELC